MSEAMTVGQQVVDLCRAGENLKAIETLYADDVVSVESMEGPGHPRRLEGHEAVLGKSKWWVENHEVHGAEIKGPYPHGDDRFALWMYYDVTFKPAGKRMQMDEIGVYTVANGKVVLEEFYYAMPG